MKGLFGGGIRNFIILFTLSCILSFFRNISSSPPSSRNDELIDELKTKGIVKSARVEQALRSVDRDEFCDLCKRSSYEDAAQEIGYAATISAPHMHAWALEILADHLKEGSKALDVGSGSGYLTTCMALMVGESGKVVGIEHIPELVETSIKHVRKNHASLLDSGRLNLILGDGRKGYKIEGPYDAIHVGAAAEEIPADLINQLNLGGRLIIPVGAQGVEQQLLQIDKLPNGEVRNQTLFNVIYIPLTDRKHQLQKT